MKTANSTLSILGLLLLSVTIMTGCQGCDEDLIEVRSRMTLDPLEVELNPVPVAADTLILFEVGNPSSISINMKNVSLSADSDPAFEIMAQPESVSPRGKETIQVKVRPMLPTTIEATLIVESNADQDPILEAHIKVTSLDMGLPDIEVDPESVVFAEVATLDVARAQVTITNVGARDLLLDGMNITWSRINTPPPPTSSQNDGGLSGETTDDAGNAIEPTTQDGGQTTSTATSGADAGASTPDTTEDNGSETALADAGMVANGDETPPFRLLTSVPSAWPLPAGQSLTVDLAFSPEHAASYLGELNIHSNDPDEAIVTVPLSGQGYACPVAVAQFLDPEDIDGLEPLDTIRLDGTDSYAQTAGGTISEYEWRLTQRPVGSTAIPIPTSARAQISCDLAGDYEVALSVNDDRGLRSCFDDFLRFSCIPTEELHIQLVWDHPYADMDLHLLREAGDVFDHDSDTYFSNREPEWYPETPAANPILDLDDNQGYGPENINVEAPQPGSRHTIYVHYWDAQTDGDAFSIATIRIYAYGQIVTEHQLAFESDEMLWQAAEIIWPDATDAGLDPTPIVNVFATTIDYPRPF
jgi:hypothetical protein